LINTLKNAFHVQTKLVQFKMKLTKLIHYPVDATTLSTQQCPVWTQQTPITFPWQSIQQILLLLEPQVIVEKWKRHVQHFTQFAHLQEAYQRDLKHLAAPLAVRELEATAP
jgi:hypothetical protein